MRVSSESGLSKQKAPPEVLVADEDEEFKMAESIVKKSLEQEKLQQQLYGAD